MVTPYAALGLLAQFVGQLRGSGSWDAKHAVQLMIDIAEGLKFLHAKGIVHRSVVPANIFVNSDGHAMIGLAPRQLADSDEIPVGADQHHTLDVNALAYVTPERVEVRYVVVVLPSHSNPLHRLLL